MVVLNKIYTRTGDGGETALGDGNRVPKHALRVSAYGTVDETNACVGLGRLHATGNVDAELTRIRPVPPGVRQGRTRRIPAVARDAGASRPAGSRD